MVLYRASFIPIWEATNQQKIRTEQHAHDVVASSSFCDSGSAPKQISRLTPSRRRRLRLLRARTSRRTNLRLVPGWALNKQMCHPSSSAVLSHVAVQETDHGDRYGIMDRYRSESACCGALHELLQGEQQPLVRELRETFCSEGHDRIAALRDLERVEPAYRSLFAALVSARLQTRKVMIDIQDYEPMSPTLYFAVPCVTLNRKGRDTEIVCGVYTADHRSAERTERYYGLGDHPAHRAHRLTQELAGSDDARQILDEIHDKVDSLDPNHARALIELLMNEYGR